jgi:DNA-binding MarR family transcriptional regulator
MKPDCVARLEKMHRPPWGARRQRRQRLSHCGRVSQVLEVLVAEGLVERRVRPDGTTGYFLTESGRGLLGE